MITGSRVNLGHTIRPATLPKKQIEMEQRFLNSQNLLVPFGLNLYQTKEQSLHLW